MLKDVITLSGIDTEVIKSSGKFRLVKLIDTGTYVILYKNHSGEIRSEYTVVATFGENYNDSLKYFNNIDAIFNPNEIREEVEFIE